MIQLNVQNISIDFKQKYKRLNSDEKPHCHNSSFLNFYHFVIIFFKEDDSENLAKKLRFFSVIKIHTQYMLME